MTDTEVVETVGELELYEPPAAPGLFGTDSPGLVIATATEISDELARVIHDKLLFSESPARNTSSSKAGRCSARC